MLCCVVVKSGIWMSLEFRVVESMGDVADEVNDSAMNE